MQQRQGAREHLKKKEEEKKCQAFTERLLPFPCFGGTSS